MESEKITIERLKELFEYHEDGYLINKVSRGRTAKAGDRAGRGIQTKNYRQIRVDGRNIREHIIIWCILKGEYPVEINHIDHDRTNNKIENLENVTHQANIQHEYKGKPHGVIPYRKTGKWIARITIKDRSKYLGIFNTYEEARASRLKAEEVYWNV